MTLSTTGALNRAKQAEALDHEELMLAPPAYSLPDQKGIITHFETIADNCPLPITLYNFPARSGVAIDYESVVYLSRHSKIKGIKESNGDFSRTLSLIQANLEDFSVICGCDDQAADFLFWGAKG